MSDETENANPSRFNKALLFRVLAVALFVLLGTFAVIQSMRGGSTSVASLENSADSLATKTGDAASGLVSGIKSSVKKVSGAFKKPPASPKTSLGNGLKPKVTSKPTNSFAKSGAFAPKTNTFGQPKPPTKLSAKKPAQPPTRYAQAPSGVPIIGNNNGFGTRPSLPKAPATTFGDKAKAAVSQLKTPSGFVATSPSTVKENLTNSASNLLRKTKEEASNAVGSLKQSASGGFGLSTKQSSNSFGPPVRPLTPKTSPASSGFGPGVPSSFGARPPASGSSSKPQPPVNRSSQKSASFDSSRNLSPVPKPNTRSGFGSQSSFGNNSSTLQRPVQPPTRQTKSSTSPFDTSRDRFDSAKTSAPPSRPLASPRTSVPAQSISTKFSSNSPTSRLGNDRNGRTSIALNSSPLSKNVPGDKVLDGVQAPALTVEKLSPREIQVNQTADFQLVVKNVGRVAADNVQVFDRVPAGTEYQAATPEPTQRSRDGSIQWNIGTLRPGQEKRIKLQLKPTQPGEIGSVAHVTFATQASMRTMVTKPVLEITHQAGQTHLIGDDVIFDVLVKNKGDGPAKNVVIQEDVPNQLGVPSQLESPDGTRGIEYEIGTLLPGQSRRVKLALKAANIGKLRNVMFASADGGLQAKHELPMEIVAPNLVTRTDGPTRRFLRRNVTHDLIVKNTGTAAATNVELIARLPSGLRFVDANNQGRYDSNAHSVYWSLAELARNVEAKVELKTMPVEVGSQPISFESFADLKIKSSAKQPLSVEHLVDVFFDIDDVVDPIEIGSNTSYRLRVVNQGTKAATNVQLQVDFPTGLQPTAVDGTLRHAINGQRIAFAPINSMSPGDEISIVIHGKGQNAGDHRVVVNMRTDGRTAPVSKEETTRVYSDR